MAALDQTAVDALIEKIDKAILKHSVSNRDVAAVLFFLNTVLKEGISKHWLRKDQEDSAADLIHFRKGIDVSEMTRTENLHVAGDSSFDGYLASKNFVSGFPEGSGWALLLNDILNSAGEKKQHAHLEIDDLTIRGRFRVYEMIISQLLGENGTRLTTDMMKVAGVDPESSKILLDTDKGVLYNPFRVGDIIMVKRFSPVDGLNEKEYELCVTGVGVGSNINSEDRLDWITYDNFIGEITDIAEGDTLVRVDSLTDPDRKGIIKHTSVEPGSPYIDIIMGMKTEPDNSVRSRFGRLDNLITDIFGRLQGFGIYCDNLYACGDFKLRNGDDVLTRFEVVEGKISSEIHAVLDKFTEEDNFLRNTSFSENMKYWEHPTEIIPFRIGSSPILLNRKIYSDKKHVAEMVQYNGRLLLQIRNSYIKQYNKDLIQPEESRTLYLTIKYLCKKAGKATYGFEGQELFFEEYIEPTGDFIEKVVSAPWDGSGDFIFKFTGDIYIELLTLTYNELQDFIVTTTTNFEQTTEQIGLLAESYHTLHGALQEHEAAFHVTSEQIDAIVKRTDTLYNDIGIIGKTIATAGWITTADGNKLWATIDEVDNLGQNLRTHESNFHVSANEIESIVKSIDTVQNRIDTAGWITTADGNKLWANRETVDELGESLSTHTASFHVSSTEIKSLFTSIDNVNKTIASAGWITNEAGNKLWASKELEDGDKLISYINQAPGETVIQANKINLVGSVTFSALTGDLQDQINMKLDGTDLGDLAFRNTVEAELLGSTIIKGGYLNTEYIKVRKLDADQGFVGGFTLESGRLIWTRSGYFGGTSRSLKLGKGSSTEGVIDVTFDAQTDGRFGVKAVGRALGSAAIYGSTSSKPTYPSGSLVYAGYFDGNVHVNGDISANGFFPKDKNGNTQSVVGDEWVMGANFHIVKGIIVGYR